jgi:hypothetical protein
VPIAASGATVLPRLALNVGLTKKIGLPEYGSLAASCHVEVETENLLQGDLAAFQDRAKQIFAACRQAVNDELARQQPANRETGPRSPSNGNGSNGSRPAPANGRTSSRQSGNGHGATTKQLDYAEQLAKQIRGVGKRGLEQLAQKMFGKPQGRRDRRRPGPQRSGNMIAEAFDRTAADLSGMDASGRRVKNRLTSGAISRPAGSLPGSNAR